MKHVLVTLIQNTTLLLAMMIVFDLVTSRKPVRDQWWRQALAGVILGELCIGLMLASFRLETVIIFARDPFYCPSAVCSLASLQHGDSIASHEVPASLSAKHFAQRME
jgi:hypothetical protein